MTTRVRRYFEDMPAASVVEMMEVASGGGTITADTDIVDCIKVSANAGGGVLETWTKGTVAYDKQPTFLSADFYVTNNDHTFSIGFGNAGNFAFLYALDPGSGMVFRLWIVDAGFTDFTVIAPAAATWYRLHLEWNATAYKATLENMATGVKEQVTEGVPTTPQPVRFAIAVQSTGSARVLKVRLNSLQTSMDHTL